MLSFLSTIFSSVFAGGATGIIGVIAQRFADYKNKQLDLQAEKQRNEFALAMKDKDAAIMQQEWAARTTIAATDADARVQVADAAAFGESLGEAALSDHAHVSRWQQWLFVLVDVVRAMIRPGLTVYLCALTTMIYLEVRVVTDVVSQDKAYELLDLIVGTILYLTTTCVLWWFGTRNKQNPPKAK